MLSPGQRIQVSVSGHKRFVLEIVKINIDQFYSDGRMSCKCKVVDNQNDKYPVGYIDSWTISENKEPFYLLSG